MALGWGQLGDRIQVGDRVQTANLTLDDSDRGRVTDIDGDMATVAWDTQVVTPCPLSDLEVES